MDATLSIAQDLSTARNQWKLVQGTPEPGWSDLAIAARDLSRNTHSDQLARVQAFQNAMSERVPSAGGFTVGEALRTDMMQATLEQAIIRPLATVIPSPALRIGIPIVDDTTHASSILGGATWTWTEEGAALASSSPSYGRLVLEAKKVAVYTGGVPDELVADADAFGVFMRTTVAAGQAWAEDQAFIAGAGTAEVPQGILNAPCAISVTRSTSSKVLQIDIVNMVTRLLPQSFKYCIWLASPDVIGQLLQLYLLIGTIPASAATAPSPWLQGTPGGGWTLLGRPLYPTEHVPALGTRGDLILVDPRFYVIADRQQMTVATSALGTKFAADQTEYRVISRMDGRIWLQTPVTPQNSSATVSPVVVLN